MKKLTPDAVFESTDFTHHLVAAAETVTIRPGQIQTVHTGLRACEPLILSLARGLGHLDMCVLLTTAVVDGHDLQVAILNRGTDPVEIKAGDLLLHVAEVQAPGDGDWQQLELPL